MLKKKSRLTKELFQGVMDTGRTITGRLFIFKYKGNNTPKFAFVAPKGLAKQAYLRNKLRRQGYYALNQKTQLPSVLGVFLYKKQQKMPIFKDISLDIDFILSKIGK